ncbi:MAG: hypothetical protein WCK90_00630 [archaeon]
MVADISFITYFAPIFVFLLVFIVVYALLVKTEVLGDSQWVALLISFIVASLFVSMAGAKEYIYSVAPWFALLLVSLFFIFVILGFAGKTDMNKGIGVAVFVILVIVFLVALFSVFSYLINYVPSQIGGGGAVGSPMLEWLYSSRVSGAVLLIIISAIVAWVLTKK